MNGLNWQCCLDVSSKTAPRVFIFSIILGAEYLSNLKSIETHARAFLTLNILFIGTVIYLLWKVSSVYEGMGWCNGRIIGSSEDYGDHVELVHVKKLFRHIISTPAKI